MRQVPHYLLIGNGRVVSHLRHYFSLLRLTYSCWSRQQSESDLKTKLAKATHVLVLITDKAIAEFARQYKNQAMWVHCSGSLYTQHAFGAHPLMTFSEHLYCLEQYQAIPFVIDADAPAFSEMLPGLTNQHVRLDPALKAKYHALCVLSGNFACLLWQKFFTELEQTFQMPKEIAHPYLMQQMQNLMLNPTLALSGPLVRGDDATLEKNLMALRTDPYHAVYESFINAYQKTVTEA